MVCKEVIIDGLRLSLENAGDKIAMNIVQPDHMHLPNRQTFRIFFRNMFICITPPKLALGFRETNTLSATQLMAELVIYLSNTFTTQEQSFSKDFHKSSTTECKKETK